MKKIIVILFLAILFFFSMATIIVEDREISSYERRKLVTISNLKDNFFDNLDDYLIDQFPLRDSFIALNSWFNRYILLNKEDNDAYLIDDYIIEKNYPLNEKSVDSFIKKMNYINKTYLQDSKVFYTVIPDKSYFLDDNKYLKINYNFLSYKLLEMDIPYFDIISLLKLSDYYKTDIHLKQSSYLKIIPEISKIYDFKYIDYDYNINKYPNFYGSSFSKVPFFKSGDELVYLSNDILDNANVWQLGYDSNKIYDIEMLDSIDSYNVFLNGASALIEIENNMVSNQKELIIFRDSFASSLAPLLVPYYQKITLIDLRYIDMNIAKEYVDFSNKDVLFLYSTLIINNSSTLKVDVK